MFLAIQQGPALKLGRKNSKTLGESKFYLVPIIMLLPKILVFLGCCLLQRRKKSSVFPHDLILNRPRSGLIKYLMKELFFAK
jgi:hypothetical protein